MVSIRIPNSLIQNIAKINDDYGFPTMSHCYIRLMENGVKMVHEFRKLQNQPESIKKFADQFDLLRDANKVFPFLDKLPEQTVKAIFAATKLNLEARKSKLQYYNKK